MEKERRTRTRVPVKFDVAINISGQEVPVKTWNLSLRGVQCSPDPLFKQGDTCQVIFILSPETNVRIEGRISRANENETGIYFSSMDEESFYHLKRLVQYNADDPDRIDNELAMPTEES
jgi:hypothetical protein